MNNTIILTMSCNGKPCTVTIMLSTEAAVLLWIENMRILTLQEGLFLWYYKLKEASFICERLYLNLISPPQLIDVSQNVVRKVPSENRVYLLTWLIVGWTRSGRLECAVKGLLFVISLYNTVLSLRYILYVRFMYFVATLKRFL